MNTFTIATGAMRLLLATVLRRVLAASAGIFKATRKARRTAQGERNPVVLIHGFCDSAKSMRRMQRWLQSRGWHVFATNLTPSDGSLSLCELAKRLAAYIEETFPKDRKIDVVGFSMGGVISRYYVQRLRGAVRVNRLITISAPHHGTLLAFLSRRPGCLEMRPGSALLNLLNSDTDALRRVQFMSIWTPLDLTIIPPSSSRMMLGQERKSWTLAHRLMIWQSSCLRQIEQFLLAASSDQSEIEDKMSRQSDSNRRPADYKSAALPAELCRHLPGKILSDALSASRFLYGYL